MENKSLKLFDSVALLKDLPEKSVVFGQVGTIVEVLNENVYEVEFADRSGETISEFAISRDDLMLLHHDLEYAKK